MPFLRIAVLVAMAAGAPVRPGAPPDSFVVPDLPPDAGRYTSYDGRLFSTHFGLAALADYNAFTQDAENVTQVGAQKDEWDTRTVRLMFRGDLKFAHPVSY